ncbi:hypothetical protein P7C73_g2394, partial [Tremellales sp. Uapishka_1]
MISSIAIVLFHKFGLNSIPAGPYGVIFSLLWQNYRTVPSLYRFRMLSIEFTNKIFVYVFAILVSYLQFPSSPSPGPFVQLFLSSSPASVLASLSGLLAGYFYRSDMLLLPTFSLSRRSLFRPLKTFRIPLSLHLLLSRLFAPFIGESMAPRRANRVLPGQVITVDPNNRAAPTLSTILRRQMGRESAAPRLRANAAAVQPPTTSPVVAASTEGARAVGAWVNTMTGGGNGARAPTEEEISALTNMFPNLSREAVVGALQRRPVYLSHFVVSTIARELTGDDVTMQAVTQRLSSQLYLFGSDNVRSQAD